jgi:replicative DNA helicase
VNSERVTPHDTDAERAILGAILVNGDRFHDVAEVLGSSDFFRVPHRTIFEAMRTLTERRQAIDLLTIKDSLSADKFEELGGAVYLASLCDGMPRSAHVGEYCRIVKDKAIRRRLQAVADQAIRDAADAELEAGVALAQAEAALYEVAAGEERGDLRSAQTVVNETYPVLQQIVENGKRMTGLSTGLADLDRMTRGLQPGNLVLLAARPATGKTALALNIADHASGKVGASTAVFSLEMSRTELMIRLITAKGRIDGHRLLSGNAHEADYGRLSHAMGELAGAPLWIDDTSSMTVSSIRGKLRRYKARHGLGLVVLDYLQLLSSERRYDNRVVEVGAMSRALKQLAKELEAPILALSQLSRAPEARSDGRPKLSDLRESGSLEQDADVVFLLHRPSEYNDQADPTEAELIIAKSRNGPTGSVRLRWSPEQTRFDNFAPEQERRSA